MAQGPSNQCKYATGYHYLLSVQNHHRQYRSTQSALAAGLDVNTSFSYAASVLQLLPRSFDHAHPPRASDFALYNYNIGWH